MFVSKQEFAFEKSLYKCEYRIYKGQNYNYKHNTKQRSSDVNNEILVDRT